MEQSVETSKIPRLCGVEFDDTHYRSKMPRPCAVEFHDACYRSRQLRLFRKRRGVCGKDEYGDKDETLRREALAS
jgi:hypothetical protein